MTFGQRGGRQPQDHLPPLKITVEMIQELDQRRQTQIANQVAAINRLLKDGSYDKEMEKLHTKLAKAISAINQVRLQLELLHKSAHNEVELARINKALKALEEQDD
jgi:hypothetical protein